MTEVWLTGPTVAARLWQGTAVLDTRQGYNKRQKWDHLPGPCLCGTWGEGSGTTGRLEVPPPAPAHPSSSLKDLEVPNYRTRPQGAAVTLGFCSSAPGEVPTHDGQG